MITDIQVVGAREVAAGLLADAAKVRGGLRTPVSQAGQELRRRIQARASGRPGPRVVTGNYRRSWSAESYSVPDGAAVSVGTNAPQGRRLEYGFNGVDSLGRKYNQPPYPHVGPAADGFEPVFERMIDAYVSKVLS